MSTKIYQLREQAPFIQMMSFIIVTEKNKLIVIDGGNKEDAEYLFRYIKELSSGKAKVDAWFLTHAHSDHVDAFMKIMNQHKDEIELEKLYLNFPKSEFFDQYLPSEACTIHEFEEMTPQFEKFIHIVSEGEKIVVDNVIFDILYTPDLQFTMNPINNSSIVFKMSANNKTVLFLGDLGIEAGNKVIKMYGKNLKSDYIQAAHHGQQGVTKEFYECVQPKGCFWCTPLWLWENNAGGGYDTYIWHTIRTRGWLSEIGVREHYVTKDKTNILVFED